MANKAWLLLSSFLLVAGEVYALRCGNRLVTTGDHQIQVSERCGTPYFTESYGVLLVSGVDSPIQRRREQVHEAWYYNFGPRNLVQRIEFVNGRVARIDSGGYGARRVGADCNDHALRPGLSTGEVFLRCGEPHGRGVAGYEDVVITDPGGGVRVRPVRREEWQYSIPGSSYLRLAHFLDGRLDRVERIPR
jgi:hypothetical protein